MKRQSLDVSTQGAGLPHFRADKLSKPDALLLCLAGHPFEDELGDVDLNLRRVATENRRLNRLRLSRKPFDKPRRDGELSHPGTVGEILKRLFGRGRKFDPHDNALGHISPMFVAYPVA